MIFGEGPIIKNIAGDLNKLFLQGSRVGQPVTNVEGDAAADQGTVALIADRDPVIRDISTGIGYAGREVTVSGTGALQLVNSLGRPLSKWRVDLTPYQEGSGAPSPGNIRPIHGTNKLTITMAGKNLFQASADSLASSQNCTIDYLPTGVKVNSTGNFGRAGFTYNTVIGQQYTCSFTVTSSGENLYRIVLDNSTNWNYAYGVVSGVRTDFFYSVTFTASTNIFMLGIYPYVSGSSYEVTNLQLEIGSTASVYTPYIDPYQTVITLPYTIYNGTIVNDGGESRFKKIELSDINESNWDYYSAPGNGVFRAKVDDVAIPPDNNTPTTAISDQLVAKAFTPIAAGDYAKFAVNGSSVLVVVTNHTISSVSDFLDQWGDIEVCYPLSTPLQFTLATPIIPTPTGDVTAWVTAEDGTVLSMEVTYLEEI